MYLTFYDREILSVGCNISISDIIKFDEAKASKNFFKYTNNI